MSEQNSPQNQDQDQNQNKNKIEERINTLYGQKKEAEESAANLEAENQNLRTQMLELQETVNNLKESVNTSQTDPAGKITPDNTDGNAGNLDADGIRKVVEETVGNVLNQRDSNVKKVEQLKQAHVNSWQQAVNQMPELKDQNSDLYQAAQRIWEKDAELKKSETGPFKAAVMARGFIGSNDTPPPDQLNSATQQHTSVSNNLSDGSKKKQLEAIESEIKTLKQDMATGKPITRTWPRFQELKMKRAELLGKTQNK